MHTRATEGLVQRGVCAMPRFALKEIVNFVQTQRPVGKLRLGALASLVPAALASAPTSRHSAYTGR